MKESTWGKPQLNLTSFMIKQCIHMVGESRDEAMIEIDKPNEQLYLFLSQHLHWIHLDLVVV
jgi:hypothetical protein